MELEGDTDRRPPPPPLRSSSSLWSELMEEVLLKILSRLLLLPDISRFGSVCSSWRSAMLSYRNLLRPPPLLVLGPCTSSSPHQLPNFFYPQSQSQSQSLLQDLHLQHFQFLPLPLFPVFPSALTSSCETLRFEFSRLGYLGYVAPRHHYYYFINPITGHHLNLPSIHGFLHHIAFSSIPTAAADDCTVVATCNREGLLLCKPGDNEWTSCVLQGSQRFQARSMTFHKGKLYALFEGKTPVFALDPPPHLKPVVKINWPVELDPIMRATTSTFLVESGGDLLLLSKRVDIDLDSDLTDFKVVEVIYKVFKLEDGRWERITSLGDDRVLLVSRYGVESFSNKEVMGSGFRSDCIYDLCVDINDLWVYSMEDESSARVSLPFRDYGQVFKTWLVPLGW